MFAASHDWEKEEFAVISPKFIGKIPVRDSSKRLLINETYEHKYLRTSPIRVNVRKGAYGDILAVSLPTVFLISDRLLKMLVEIRATGYEAIPADVKLLFPHHRNDAVFWQLVVTGWGGVASPSSGISKLDDRMFGKEKYTHCIDPSKIVDRTAWDGSDFFLVWPMPFDTWVSPRIIDLLVRERIRHYVVTPAKNINFARLDDDPIGFGPLPLACYFPDFQAHKVGAPLGIYWYEWTNLDYSSLQEE